MIKMKINHKKVKQLNSFKGVKLRGDETFDELLEIEKKNMLKGTIICKAKKCNKYLYKNQSQINPQYCSECV
jgi:bacillopeptidase F (M6 metalloprotease family)